MFPRHIRTFFAIHQRSFAWAEKQLGSIVKKLSDDKAKKVIDAIKKEKDSASEGFGELFG